jgi:hypothetical protein
MKLQTFIVILREKRNINIKFDKRLLSHLVLILMIE